MVPLVAPPRLLEHQTLSNSLLNNMAKGETVVKCGGCSKFFVHTNAIPACPFCHTEYDENAENAENAEIAEKETKERKVPVKTKKESFKIWKDS